MILGMPISKMECPDRLNWHLSKNGLYTAKSGYQVVYDMQRNGKQGMTSTGDDGQKVWRGIWHLNVPNKLKCYI